MEKERIVDIALQLFEEHLTYLDPKDILQVALILQIISMEKLYGKYSIQEWSSYD